MTDIRAQAEPVIDNAAEKKVNEMADLQKRYLDHEGRVEGKLQTKILVKGVKDGTLQYHIEIDFSQCNAEDKEAIEYTYVPNAKKAAFGFN